jgi:spore maturation protein SpmA
VLAHLWFGFFIIAYACGVYQWLVNDQGEIFSRLVQSTFEMSALGVNIALGLIGVLCLWLGLFEIASRACVIDTLAKLLAPLFRRLMPEVPAGHPALGSITMNLAANMLGLDNAATPMGLRAMQELQSLNPNADTATNAQILFLVLNTSSVTILPVTIFLYRAQQGSEDPTSVFIPILLATCSSTLTGLIAVAWFQRLRLFDRVVLAYFAGFGLLMATFVLYLSHLSPLRLTEQSSLLGNLVLFSIMMLFLAVGVWRKVNVYEAFIDGAKQGFEVAIKIIPYLVGMLVAIGVLRASGALDGVLKGLEGFFSLIGVNTEFIPALPTALMKPLSGSGARAMMLETMNTYGVDSFPAVLSAIIQGSTETTFYVLAVYFGSVGIRRVRHALTCGLLADLTGICTAIVVGYWFFY